MNLKDPYTKLQAEYELHYSVPNSDKQRKVHIFIYNKDGFKITEFSRFVKRIGKRQLMAYFGKTMIILCAILVYFILLQICHMHIQHPIPGSFSALTWKYKSLVFVVLAVCVVLVFTIDKFKAKLKEFGDTIRIAKVIFTKKRK
jgi:uncharacterized membrane protein